MIRYFCLSFAMAFCLLLGGCDKKTAYDEATITFETAPLAILTQAGERHSFTVEVAQSQKQIAYGLMFREELADDKGMIFLFNDEDYRQFWMKNTLIFLDILFIDEQGRIVSIHPMAQPHDERTIHSIYPAKAALEIRGGLAQELGIIAGDRIEFKTL